MAKSSKNLGQYLSKSSLTLPRDGVKQAQAVQHIDPLMQQSLHKFMDLTIVSEVAVDINAGFLNGSGNVKEGGKVVTKIKSFLSPEAGKPLSYCSAQALRKWLRETLINISDIEYANYYIRLGTVLDGSISQNLEGKIADPVYYLEDDLFGYIHPLFDHAQINQDNMAKDRPDVVAVTRIAPLRVSQLTAIPEACFIKADKSFVHLPDDTPLPYSCEFSCGFFTYTALLELGRVGEFVNKADLLELDNRLAEYYLSKQFLEKLPPKDSNAERFRLVDPLRLERKKASLELFLTSLFVLNGGAKSAQFASDLSPKLIVLAAQASTNPVFMNIIESDGEKLLLNIKELMDRIDRDFVLNNFKSNIYIGIRTGSIVNEADIRSLHHKRVGSFEIIVSSPALAIRGLQRELCGEAQ